MCIIKNINKKNMPYWRPEDVLEASFIWLHKATKRPRDKDFYINVILLNWLHSRKGWRYGIRILELNSMTRRIFVLSNRICIITAYFHSRTGRIIYHFSISHKNATFILWQLKIKTSSDFFLSRYYEKLVICLQVVQLYYKLFLAGIPVEKGVLKCLDVYYPLARILKNLENSIVLVLKIKEGCNNTFSMQALSSECPQEKHA